MSKKYGEVVRSGERSDLALKMYEKMSNGDVLLVVDALEDATDMAIEGFSNPIDFHNVMSKKYAELLKIAISGLRDSIKLANETRPK